MSFSLISANYSADPFSYLKKSETAKKTFPSENNADDSDGDTENGNDNLGMSDAALSYCMCPEKQKSFFLTTACRFNRGHWNISTPPPRP